MPDIRGKTESIPKAVKRLLLDAWNNEQWIYDRLDDKWYTPEEFKAKWTVLITAYNQAYRLKMGHPYR